MIVDEDMVVVTEAANNSSLWHQRLGHISEKGMKLMAAKGKLSILKHVDVGVCEHCIFGKQKKVSFSKAKKTPKVEKLELVHTDVWGPTTVKYVGNSAIMSPLSMTLPERYGFIFLKINLMCFLCLKGGKQKLKIR